MNPRTKLLARIVLTLPYLFLFFTTSAQTTYTGKPGIFVLGTADQPIANSFYTLPYVAGTAVRTRWGTLEPAPGQYNWTFIDGEIAAARNFHKYISLLVIGTPTWMDSLGVPTYRYIEQNPNNPNYLDTLTAPITWSIAYADRLKQLISALATRYAQDTTLIYTNCVAGMMNNNLPTKVADGSNFWTATNYHRDTLLLRMQEVLDHYMQVFPHTPTWNSLENIPFEMQASGHPPTEVIRRFSAYGDSLYPDRFGVWREDLHGCVNLTTTQSHWNVVASYPCRTGAQALWSVQDGPTRMNQCGITPNTKQEVLWQLFLKGFSMNMRYYEIYQADITDTSLATLFLTAGDSIHSLFLDCSPPSHFPLPSTLILHP